MKILLSLALSLIIVFSLNKIVFFNGIPKINREKIKTIVKDVRNNLIIFKNKFKYRLAKNKVDYNQILFDNSSKINSQKIFFPPTIHLSKINPTTKPELKKPNISPTVIVFISPTIKPTSTLSPQLPTITPPPPSPTLKILKPSPTKKIKPTPTPTPTPTPSSKPSNVPIINDPFSQPYYDPTKAYKCYTPSKFIEVYANGVNPDSCYNNVKSEVQANLTSVSILGKTITVHKKAYSAFKAAADELAKNKTAINYKINTIGAYVFRCNVNASTGDPYDTCQSGCVLSSHAFGIAVDINWKENCNGCSSYTMPIEIVEIFEKYGFRWGGRYKEIFGATIDPMHFEYLYDLCKDLN